MNERARVQCNRKEKTEKERIDGDDDASRLNIFFLLLLLLPAILFSPSLLLFLSTSMSSNKLHFRSNRQEREVDKAVCFFFSSFFSRLNISNERMTESENGLTGGGMEIDPAFASIPKNKSCLCIWRVEVGP